MLQSIRSSAKYIWIILIIAFIGGFLLVETSGLLGRAPITPGTPVAEVNGEDIPYLTWANAAQARAQQEEQQIGRALTLDERRRLEDDVFDQMVNEILLRQEYERRDIAVSNDEIIAAAQNSPPPQLLGAAELQTEGQFDIQKYRRFIASPAARQQGLLVQLENYYRTEIPRQKLFEQLATDVYVSDARLWQIFRDGNDSAQVTYVSLEADSAAIAAANVPDAEMRAYYDENRASFDRPGRATLSVLMIPRAVTAADTAATRERLLALRQEILGGAKFEDVARRESADSASGAQGGDLGRGARGRFVEEFERAAYALSAGEISQPVLSPYGYHLIKVDERKGDTLALRHILLNIRQSDSTASRTDRKADSLAAIAASADTPARFDSAARVLKLEPSRGTAIQGQPLFLDGRIIPSVSAWAFDGVSVGETSELFDTEDGYYIARLDSLTRGGQLSFDDAKPEIRRLLASRKAVDALVPRAQQIAQSARSSSLEAAARAAGLETAQTPVFTRAMPVPGLGAGNEAVGAAFGLPQGAVSAPVKTSDAVYVLRVDRRVNADSASWVSQKTAQRRQVLDALRQQRARAFMEELRRRADVEDHREQINASVRRQGAA